MPTPSNGFIADVIREIMPPYHLSADHLDGTFAVLPPPPRDARPSWRQARITRLIGAMVAFPAADAGPARLAAENVIAWELEDTVAIRAYPPDVTMERVCRLCRISTDGVRSGGAPDPVGRGGAELVPVSGRYGHTGPGPPSGSDTRTRV